MRAFFDFFYREVLINNETIIVEFDFILRNLNCFRLL